MQDRITATGLKLSYVNFKLKFMAIICNTITTMDPMIFLEEDKFCVVILVG
jgi:hypothetical protein